MRVNGFRPLNEYADEIVCWAEIDYIVMAYPVMAYVIMAYIVMGCVLMAYRCEWMGSGR